MKVLQLEIHDPSVLSKIHEMAESGLVSVKQLTEEGFMARVNKLRNQAESNIPSAEEIRKDLQVVMHSIIPSRKYFKIRF
ncbi:hypothetical protein [Albibacterium indicum]|uniref:hypothetical protein n=1 Tax=Albibacterium indicum TaxID=2292082 RepID=UPI000E524D01|nr:hypothetical protein [Pedobacter indicus]